MPDSWEQRSDVRLLAVQVRELAKAYDRHERLHRAERRERTAARRWMIGAAIAAIAAVDGPVVTVLLAIHR